MAVYDPSGGGDVHIDKVLTNISLAYPNNGLVGDVLFPTVRVAKQSDLYYEHGQEGWLPEDDHRAPGTEAIEVPGLKVSTHPYFALERSLQIAVTDEERQNADRPLDPDRDGTDHVTSKIMLRREQRMQVLVHTAANYNASHTVTLAGGAQWDVYATSTPIADIKTGLRQVHSALFMEPNLAVIPYEVMTQLEDHPDFIERIKYSQTGIVTADLIAAVVGLQNIVVPGLGFDSSGNPGSPLTLAYLWAKDVVLAWVPARAGLRLPAFAYEFNWRFPGGQVQVADRWREKRRKSDIIRVSRRYDLRFIAVDGAGLSTAGYLIKAAVA